MAKKVDFDNPDMDDLSDLDDLDFGGDDLFPEDGGDERSPVGEFKRSAISGFKEAILGRDSIKRLIGATLGTGFADAVDTYDELSAAVAETVGANEQQGRSLIRDVTGIVDESSPRASRLIPDWLRKEGDKASSEIDSDEDEDEDAGVNSDIKGINDLLNFTRRAEKDKVARDGANRLKDAKIADTNLKSSAGIISAVKRLSNYQEKVTLNYQRKSLEQGYRVINLLAKTHQLHLNQYGILNEAVSSIQKNTALPDYVKMSGPEFVKANIRNRLTDATVNKLSLGLKPIVDRVKGQISEGIAGFGMLTDQFGQEGGMSPAGMIGGMAGEWVGDKASKLGSAALQRALPALQKIPGFESVEKANNLLQRYGNNLPMLINTLAENGHENEYINELIKFIAPDSQGVALRQTGMEELDDGAPFDVRTHRTINDIIPAYLASMDKNLAELITGEVSEERQWDHFTGSMSTKSSVLKNVMNRGIKEGDTDKVRYEVDQLLDQMNAWSLSSDAKNALRVELTRKLIKGVQFNPADFMEEKMWESYPTFVIREIRGMLMERFGLTDEGEFSSTADETKFWEFHKEEYATRAKSISDYSNRFNEYTTLTGVEPWVESGIIHRDAAGNYTRNDQAFLEQLLSPSDDYTFEGRQTDEDKKKAEIEAQKEKLRNMGRGITSKLTPWRRDPEELQELREGMSEDEAAASSVFEARHSPLDRAKARVPGLKSTLDRVDTFKNEMMAEEDESVGFWDRLKTTSLWGRGKSAVDDTHKRVSGSKANKLLSELKEYLKTHDMSEILDDSKAKYDQTFTKEKAKEIRNFLGNTKVGKKATEYLAKGEEVVKSGGLDDIKKRGSNFIKGIGAQTSSGFAREVGPTSSLEDIGTHERLDQLNEIQLAQQVILSELLEVTTQLPYLIGGADSAGMSDVIVRNRQTRMARFSRFMRSQGDRIRGSKVGRLAGTARNMLGTAAQGAWSGVGLMGRGLRGTMGLAIKAGSLATKGTVGLAKLGGKGALGALKGTGSLLAGAGAGAGSLLKGSGKVAGGLLESLGAAIPALASGSMSVLKGGAGLMSKAAASPFKLVGALAKTMYGGKDEYRDYDAYAEGEEQPRILSSKLKAGEYKDMDGNPIKSLDQIGGPLYGPDDNIVITEVEYASKMKLYSLSGKVLIELGSSLMGKGKVASGIRRMFRPIRKVTGAISGAIKGILSAPFKLIGSAFSRIRSAVSGGDKAELGVVIAYEQLGIQSQILQLMKERKRSGDDDDPDANSWDGIQLTRKNRGKVTLKEIKESLDKHGEATTKHLGDIAENTDDSDKGIFSKIYGAIKGLGPMIMAGLGKVGGALAATKVGGAVVSAFTGAKAAIAGKGLLALAGTGLKAIGAGILAVVGAPALIIAGIVLATAATGYFLYRGYKASQAKKMHLTYIRMAEYGINPADAESVGKVAAVEAEFAMHTKVTSKDGSVSNVTVDMNKISANLESIYAIFGFDYADYVASGGDKKHEGYKLQDWLVNRFFPVFRTHYHAATEANGKVNFKTLEDSISGAKGLKYLSTAKVVQQTYFRESKYITPTAAWKDRSSSPFTSNWIRKDVWADEEDISEAYDRAEIHYRKQDEKSTADTETGIATTVTGRTDVAAVNKMKSESTLMVSNEGTSDLVEINRGIKGSGAFSSAYGTNNFVQGDEYSMTRNLDRLDTGSAIRYMAYGLNKLEMIKVEHLWSLEKYVLELLPHGSERFQYPRNIYEKATAIFAPATDEAKKALKFWLDSRFLVVLEHYFYALISQSKMDVTKAYSSLNPKAKWTVIKTMLDRISNHSKKDKEDETYSIWNITESPWDGYSSNVDPGSVSDYLAMLEKPVAKFEAEVEGAKSLLAGTLPESTAITLPSGKEISAFSLYGNTKGTKAETQNVIPRTGVDLLMGANGGGAIVTSGRPHKPLSGHGNEAGERALLAAIREAGITDPNEIAMIMGQVSEETGRFSRIEENLNYRAERMAQVWPSRFRNRPDFARKLAEAGPEAIANEIYGDRMGNTEPGDGWKYRGRGYIQLTGKDNYKKIGDYLGIDLVGNPDLVNSSPEMAAKTAVAYWMTRGSGIRSAAQRGDVRQVTRLVNGGETGLSERRRHVAHYTKELPNLLQAADKPQMAAADAAVDLPDHQGHTNAFSGATPGTGTVSAPTPPVSAQMAAVAPPERPVNRDPVMQRAAEQQRARVDEMRARNAQQKESESQEVSVTVNGDEETKGIMGNQLGQQQIMVDVLTRMEASMAELNAKSSGAAVPPKATPSRSIPSSNRQTG